MALLALKLIPYAEIAKSYLTQFSMAQNWRVVPLHYIVPHFIAKGHPAWGICGIVVRL